MQLPICPDLAVDNFEAHIAGNFIVQEIGISISTCASQKQ